MDISLCTGSLGALLFSMQAEGGYMRTCCQAVTLHA